ncbi:DegT/DnrJ/EryC1/StrS family aminotransferase [Pseudobutyrivibrio xylanivorans]|uniref:dTDP-4-amino-4,6-dideoxygalactose transaminase n=1 Tax=Pseudobutyrivibrio xylanivorans DSM 14809 TaxID=1123012 RepID=A0A1M6IG06_PSEXY|nr:DegT/DnrJ/EryC1/StrS family aminotransferase [Pseudobutyrivibrio xylanivorans]SHJ33361.1 dTDP-4-amino-4,6-dideoxygalactose transaminase [Pseudobutyrivibrio xylanivorans DSM 14809]
MSNNVMNEEIYVTKPVLPPFEEYEEYLRDIWNTHQLTNLGKYTLEFIGQLKEYLDVEQCLTLCNGHMALEMILQAMNLSGEVITTPFTFASTTHAIVRNGLTPVFCDIKESDCTIDADKIESLITDKTSAIVPVHVYGMPCDIKKIEEIAKKHNLKVIYDAAHAFGEKVNGESIAKAGDASMFSFHATKAFNTIEGGCAVTNDYDVIKRVYQLHNFGIMDEENVEYVGANAKMNEFQAAMGLCNLKHFEENRLKRKKLYDYYRERLSKIKGIQLLKYDEDAVELNYTYCPIIVNEDDYGINRDDLHKLLGEQGIHVRKYFYPITNEFACYKDFDFNGDVPIAHRVSRQILTLPLYTDLEMYQVQRICDLIEKREMKNESRN